MTKFALCFLSRNPAKYLDRIERLVHGCRTDGACSTTNLFDTMVVASTAAPILSSLQSHSLPIVLLADNDIPDMPAIAEGLQSVLQEGRVRWIHTLSTGVDVFQFAKWRHLLPATVPVSNARGVFSNILAEHVLFSILYFQRSTWRIQRQQVERTWDRFPMLPLEGRSVGIVGYGDIGQACGRTLRRMGMQVTGLRRRAVAPDAPRNAQGQPVDEHGVVLVSGDEAGLAAVLECDVVVNVMPRTAENYHYFDAAMFARMKRDALYINIGRGATQNEGDLARALEEGVIRGAAVDVFEIEPLPDESPLWRVGSDKLLLTPHNAVIDEGIFTERAEYFGMLAKAFVEDGAIPQYLVDVHGTGY